MKKNHKRVTENNLMLLIIIFESGKICVFSKLYWNTATSSLPKREAKMVTIGL